MNEVQQHFIEQVISFANLLENQYGLITMLNALYNGQTTNYSSILTDEMIASVDQFVGFNKSNLNEVAYIIGQLKDLVDGRIEHIAALGR